MASAIGIVPWLDVTNVICNTIQVLGLAYIGSLVSGDISRRRAERRFDMARQNRMDEEAENRFE